MRDQNNPYRNPFQSWVGATPSSSEDLRAMRAAIWHKQGIIVVPLQDITDRHIRNMLQELAEKLYGQRRISA